ncbi:DNA-3-methyladenine glycosylase I [Actinomyces sp. 2119]|uniref:DNA-3-methyladenine glycosylase I n=1 Tax=Actinomyces lilanjuaniae TaxID=2321394 RepID=A0ABM6Z611_9ACTO|nr:DNA-3-methyladenine glycosylase I [Actinomyces lilanjuaniae]RJF43312.1 DNA-3-methyladenine glycosylase I [Actinomyces sp. 2119]
MPGGLVVGADGLVRPTWAAASQLEQDYYDHEWGNEVHDESGVFERLSLEGFQAGLSWVVILRKRPHFREVFHNFDPEKVAAFDSSDVDRLAADPGIVRNRRKIEAVVSNAAAVLELRTEGGLSALVWSYRPSQPHRPLSGEEVPSTSPESEACAKELRRRGFRFVGPTTVYALMQAIGIVNDHVVGSHRRPH